MVLGVPNKAPSLNRTRLRTADLELLCLSSGLAFRTVFSASSNAASILNVPLR